MKTRETELEMLLRLCFSTIEEYNSGADNVSVPITIARNAMILFAEQEKSVERENWKTEISLLQSEMMEHYCNNHNNDGANYQFMMRRFEELRGEGKI